MWTRRGFLGSLSLSPAAPSLIAQESRVGRPKIKITDLRCAIIGRNPVVRIVTDQGVSGYGQAESTKPYLKPMVLFYKDHLLGEDPTDVERVMLKIRRLGAFKPWGSAVSAIEIALWDIAGQVAGVPVYKLLGGKIRDRVRIYNGGFRPPMRGQMPQDYAETVQKMKEAREGFTLIKMAVGFHNSAMMRAIPEMWYDEPRGGASHPNRGVMTERGLKHIIACVEAMKKVLGSDVGAGRTKATDNGDGTWSITGVKRFITNGDFDWPENIVHLVLARPDGAGPGTKGLSLFIVPKLWLNEDGSLGDRNAAVVTNIEDKMGLKASSTCEVTFDGARGVLVGEVHDGIRQMFKVIEYARMLIGTKAIAESRLVLPMRSAMTSITGFFFMSEKPRLPK